MKSTNVSATCYPVYVVEFPVENSVCPCASRMLERCTPHARDLHSLNNVKQAAPRGPPISVTCTNPPDEREGGHRKARFAWKPFLCSCCTKRASIWRWGTGNRRVRRVGWGHRAAEPPLDVRSSRAFALRRPNDTKPVFPARFKRVKVAKRCWRRHNVAGNTIRIRRREAFSIQAQKPSCPRKRAREGGAFTKPGLQRRALPLTIRRR